MAIYQYTAKDKAGNKFSGIYNIENVASLREELTKIGYVLIKARKERSLSAPHKKIKQSEIATFAYKFSGMYTAGLPILKCLDMLEQQTENKSLTYIIADIRQGVESGLNLKNAFEKYRHVFSDFFVGMIEAGETAGELGKTLNMSAEYLEKQVELKRKIKAAFAYPIIVSVLCLVVVSYLLICIVPVFLKLYNQLRVPLPGPTRALVYLSTMIRDGWWAIIIVGFAAVIAIRQLLRKPRIKAMWDDFKLTKMPLFAKINRMVAASRFTRTFAMLCSVGVPMIEALEVAGLVVHNYRMTKIAKELQIDVEAGHPIAASMENHSIFPPIITQLAASGEEAGMLPDMLNKGTDFVDKDIERTINALLVKLEPALTVIMGLIVGFLLLGVYLPMFDYMGHLK